MSDKSVKVALAILITTCFFIGFLLPRIIDVPVNYIKALSPVSKNGANIQGFKTNAVYNDNMRLYKKRDYAWIDTSVKRFGSWLQSDSSTGRYVSPWYETDKNFDILVTGYPGRINNSLKIEFENSPKILYIKDRIGEKWDIFKIPITKPTHFRIIAVDNSKKLGGWVGVSTPFYKYNTVLSQIVSISRHIFLAVLIATLCIFLFPFEKILALLKMPSTQFIVIALILSAIAFPSDSLYIILYYIIVEVFALFLLLFIPGFYLLRLSNKLYFDQDTAFLLSFPATIILFTLVFIILKSFSATPVWYLVVYIFSLTVIFYFSHRRKVIGDIFKMSALTQYCFITIFIATIVSICFVSVGLHSPFSNIQNWGQVAMRGFRSLPCDNRLQFDTAKVLIYNQNPWIWPHNSWTMGDRPPLMAIINSVIALITQGFLYLFYGVKDYHYHFSQYQIVGIVLNVVFLYPFTIIANKIFHKKIVVAILPIAIFINIFFFLNIYFTWPKLFALSFILFAIALVMAKPLGYKTASICGILCSTATMCHGAAALSLPALVGFYSLYGLYKYKFKYIKWALAFVLFFILIQLPWSVYKKSHPVINTQKLFYDHYLPKAYRPQSTSSDHLKSSFIGFMSETTIDYQKKHRLTNLSNILSKHSFKYSVHALFTGKWNGYLDTVYPNIFFHPVSLIGEIPIILSLIFSIFYLLAYFLSDCKKKPPFNVPVIVFFLISLLFSYFFNILLKWSPSCNHELPYLEPVILIMIFVGVACSACVASRLTVMGWLCILFAFNVVYTSVRHKYFIIDFYNVMVIVGVIMMFYLANSYSKIIEGVSCECAKQS